MRTNFLRSAGLFYKDLKIGVREVGSLPGPAELAFIFFSFSRPFLWFWIWFFLIGPLDFKEGSAFLGSSRDPPLTPILKFIGAPFGPPSVGLPLSINFRHLATYQVVKYNYL